jgi:plasmid stabilization system protein ParE
VRVVPLLRYPYNLFYRNTGEAIEILSIQHSAQDKRRDI